jgi:hypothetical protein
MQIFRCYKQFPVKQMLHGLLSFIPFLYKIYKHFIGESSYSSSNPRFCYSLWLRILITLENNKIPVNLDNIAEIGSSSSLGVCLAALITGTRSYSSLEIKKYEFVHKNLIMFEELVHLFRKREAIPDDREFPRINIKLSSYKFPYDILSEEDLSLLLSESRLNDIRKSINNLGKRNIILKCYVPWEDSLDKLNESFDLIFSRAVLEHISKFPEIYSKLKICLKETGVMLHDIEYHNHGIGLYWNSHWCYSRLMWKLIKGNRSLITNRSVHSMHIKAMQNLGFTILANKRIIRESVINRKCLTKRFKNMNDIDLKSYGGWILATAEDNRLKNSNIED